MLHLEIYLHLHCWIEMTMIDIVGYMMMSSLIVVAALEGR